MKNLGKVFLIAISLIGFISPSVYAKQVTVKITNMEGGEEAVSFLDTKGKRYVAMVISDGSPADETKGVQYLDEGRTVCLNVSYYNNGIGYVKSVKQGKCKK